MEKSWENFWTTGKVEDYLTYCNRMKECKGKEKDILTSCEKEDTISKEEYTLRRRDTFT